MIFFSGDRGALDLLFATATTVYNSNVNFIYLHYPLNFGRLHLAKSPCICQLNTQIMKSITLDIVSRFCPWS